MIVQSYWVQIFAWVYSYTIRWTYMAHYYVIYNVPTVQKNTKNLINIFFIILLENFKSKLNQTFCRALTSKNTCFNASSFLVFLICFCTWLYIFCTLFCFRFCQWYIIMSQNYERISPLIYIYFLCLFFQHILWDFVNL